MTFNPAIAATGPLNTLKTPVNPEVPEFLKYLNDCPPPEPVIPKAPGDDQLQKFVEQKVLPQIWSRLSGTCDHIWDYGCRKYGHDVYWQPDTLEEQWARTCTELLSLTSYNGPPAYGKECGTNEFFYGSFRSDNPNIVMPIGLACEHLCTYALLIRGYPGQVLKGLTAEGKPWTIGGKQIFGATGYSNEHLNHIFSNGWDSSCSTYEAAFMRERPLSPASLIGYGAGAPGLPGAHVVFVLRTCSSISKAQFLDTGVVHQDIRVPYAVLESTGNYEGPLRPDSNNGGASFPLPKKAKCLGIGVLKSEQSVERLSIGIALARRARPLGIARLALFRRALRGVPNDILYLSPWLLMHDPESTASFFPTKLLWSLRSLPGYEDLQALWRVDFVAHKLAQTLALAQHSTPLHEILSDAKQQLSTHTDAMYLSVDAQGRAYCLRRTKSKPDPNDNKKTIDASLPSGALDNLKEVVSAMKQTPPGGHLTHKSWTSTFVAPPLFAQWPPPN